MEGGSFKERDLNSEERPLALLHLLGPARLPPDSSLSSLELAQEIYFTLAIELKRASAPSRRPDSFPICRYVPQLAKTVDYALPLAIMSYPKGPPRRSALAFLAHPGFSWVVLRPPGSS